LLFSFRIGHSIGPGNKIIISLRIKTSSEVRLSSDLYHYIRSKNSNEDTPSVAGFFKGFILSEESAYSSTGCHQDENSLIFQNFLVTIGWWDVLCAVLMGIALQRFRCQDLHKMNIVNFYY